MKRNLKQCPYIVGAKCTVISKEKCDSCEFLFEYKEDILSRVENKMPASCTTQDVVDACKKAELQEKISLLEKTLYRKNTWINF